MQVLTRLSHVALAVALAAGALAPAHAAPAAASGAAPAAAPIDAEKQKLIDRVLALWHPENAIIMMVQRPAADSMDKARQVLAQNQVPEAKATAALKDMGTDAQKYVDTIVPVAKASALKNMNPAIGPILAQNFSNDELKQLIALLESPVKAKFEKFAPDMERAIAQRVQADAGAEVNKDIQTMNTGIGNKLRTVLSAPAASAPAGK